MTPPCVRRPSNESDAEGSGPSKGHRTSLVPATSPLKSTVVAPHILRRGKLWSETKTSTRPCSDNGRNPNASRASTDWPPFPVVCPTWLHAALKVVMEPTKPSPATNRRARRTTVCGRRLLHIPEPPSPGMADSNRKAALRESSHECQDQFMGDSTRSGPRATRGVLTRDGRGRGGRVGQRSCGPWSFRQCGPPGLPCFRGRLTILCQLILYTGPRQLGLWPIVVGRP